MKTASLYVASIVLLFYRIIFADRQITTLISPVVQEINIYSTGSAVHRLTATVILSSNLYRCISFFSLDIFRISDSSSQSSLRCSFISISFSVLSSLFYLHFLLFQLTFSLQWILPPKISLRVTVLCLRTLGGSFRLTPLASVTTYNRRSAWGWIRLRIQTKLYATSTKYAAAR